MTTDHTDMTELGRSEQSSHPAENGSILDFDWKEMFLGQRRPTTLFDGFRDRVERERSRHRGRDMVRVAVAPPEVRVTEAICDVIAKRLVRLTEVLRSRDMPELLKAETIHIAETALSKHADSALLRSDPTVHGAQDIWNWIDKNERQVLSRSDWQKIIAVLFLRLLKGVLTVKQINEFLWRALFTEKRIPPEQVWMEIDKGSLIRVDECMCSELISRMAGVTGTTEERLVVILQRYRGNKTVVMEQILVVAERFLMGKDMPLALSLSAQDTFTARIEEWLGQRKDKRLSQKESNGFLAALLVGRRKDVLSEEEATRLFHVLLINMGQKKKGPKQDEIPNISPAVLVAPPGKGSVVAYEVFVGMLGKQQELESLLTKLRSQIESGELEKKHLQDILADRSIEIDGLKATVSALESGKKTLQEKNVEFEQSLMQFLDGSNHKIAQIRSRARSALEGPTLRYLQNALEALRIDPPWIDAAEEKIEDAMRLLKKEAECLRPSE